MTLEYRIGDIRDRLAEIPDGSIDLVVTSPPFLALRSYLPADHPDKHREIGSEATPADFLETLLALTAEFGRVLAPHGSICVELGDTFSGSGGAGGDYAPADPSNGTWAMRAGQPKFDGSAAKARKARRSPPNTSHRTHADGSIKTPPDVRRGEPKNVEQLLPDNGGPGWPLAKSLTGIPTLYAWSLAYGRNLLTGQPSPAGQWRIRNLIVWARPNPPVGALGDKFRPATSYITVACKSAKRYFDLDAVRTTPTQDPATYSGNGYSKGSPMGIVGNESMPGNPAGAPPLDWHADHHPEDGDWLWKLSTQPYAGSHYATFPMALPKRLIEAMCPLRVCTVCGRPSERIVDKPTELSDRHREFSSMIRDRRHAAGLTQRDVDEAFGFNGMCSHWERQTDTDKAQPAYPTAEHWPKLRVLLGIETDEYDDLIEGYRGWSDREHTPEYAAAIARTRAEGFYTSTGNDGMARVGVNGRSTTAGHQTLGWSDCGHDNWRTGIVLDPFAGSGTTLEAAQAVGRHAIGIDLDARNADLARERVGMFMTIDDGAAA